jgi:peptidoglycan/xylan/chitin deacetylase (PgdA/CDA1 family)
MNGKSPIGCFLILISLIIGLNVAAKMQVRAVKGPAVVAKLDGRIWPEPVNTQTGFDRASRAAILLYALSLEEMKTVSDAEMQTTFNTRSLNRRSVDQWLDKELRLSAGNYQLASKNCPASDWTCASNVSNSGDLTAKARTLAIPASFRDWQANFTQFVRNYIIEQLRLAALFPKVTSEIALFNANEWNGDALGDRQFFLTFDDGPTAPAGNTDGVLAMLAANKKTAVFFVLGENFQNRLNKTDPAAVAAAYQGQCIAFHGWQHQSHAKWSLWQTSVTRTQTLVKTTFGNYPGILPLFRPPFGQRLPDSGTFFQNQGLQVALWNLDSQDWNQQVDAEDIINRMLTLMLIKRHGVMLFHDIHPKAVKAVPVILEESGAAVEWGDCHQIANKSNNAVSTDSQPNEDAINAGVSEAVPQNGGDSQRKGLLCQISDSFCDQAAPGFNFLKYFVVFSLLMILFFATLRLCGKYYFRKLKH